MIHAEEDIKDDEDEDDRIPGLIRKEVQRNSIAVSPTAHASSMRPSLTILILYSKPLLSPEVWQFDE